MLVKIQLPLILYLIQTSLGQIYFRVEDDDKDKPSLLKIESKEIFNTFKTVLSQYVAQMANDVAQKAAEQFIDKLKNKQPQKDFKQTTEMEHLVVLPKEVEPKTTFNMSEKQTKLQMERAVTSAAITANVPTRTTIPAKVKNIFDLTYKTTPKPIVNVEPDVVKKETENPATIQPNSKLPKPDEAKEDKEELDERVAFALLKEPSPDGDDFELSSLEIAQIKDSIPDFRVKKINGMYLRRKYLS